MLVYMSSVFHTLLFINSNHSYIYLMNYLPDIAYDILPLQSSQSQLTPSLVLSISLIIHIFFSHEILLITFSLLDQYHDHQHPINNLPSMNHTFSYYSLQMDIASINNNNLFLLRQLAFSCLIAKNYNPSKNTQVESLLISLVSLLNSILNHYYDQYTYNYLMLYKQTYL